VPRELLDASLDRLGFRVPDMGGRSVLSFPQATPWPAPVPDERAYSHLVPDAVLPREGWLWLVLFEGIL